MQTAEEIKAGKQRVIKLAVDGYALLYYLYFSSNFNCVCGGQYMQFAEHTRTYVSNLLKCGFSPFVSFFVRERCFLRALRACVGEARLGRRDCLHCANG